MMNIRLLMSSMLMAAVAVAQEPVVDAASGAEAVVAEQAAVVAEETVVDTESAPAVVMQPVALLAAGDVDAALVERAQTWAQDNLAIPVPVLPAEPGWQFATFDEIAQKVAMIMENDRAGIVVLWRPSSDVMNHGAVFPDQRVSVVNLNPMLTPDTDSETIERRIERQVIRGICFVLGLDPNPNPMSAMFSYTSIEELDSIGRNLDPPWLQRLQQRAVELGIPVDPENPFNMIQ